MIRRTVSERILLGAGRRPRLVFVVTALVVAVALAAAMRLRFDADVLRLLPEKNPAVRVYRQTLEQFGTVDYFVAAVRIPEGVPIDPYLGFGDELAARMAASDLFVSVESRLGEPEDLLREFLPRSMLFLGAEERERLVERLSDEAVRARVRELRRTLETPQAVALKDLLKLDPLGLSEIFLDLVASGRGPLAVDWTSGRYVSRDHRLMLVLGRPVRSAQDLAFNHELVAAMVSEARAAREDWSELAAGLDLPEPEVFWGGRYVITLADESLIWRDVTINVVSTVLGVLALFWLAYRRASLLALVFAPLFCGLTVTFGFAAVVVGELAMTTAGVAALLIGLGNDFVIVLYGRYVAERFRGAPLAESLRAMGGATARGVVLGAVTTAATFFAFLITDFTGLWQMGLIVGSGILFCLVAVMVLVPAMLSWSEERHRRRETAPRLHVFAFGSEHLTRLAMARPGPTLVVAAVLTAASLVAAPHLGFNDSVEALRPQGNAGILAQQEINRHFGSGFDHMSLVVEGATLDEVLALTERASDEARRLVEEGRLGGYDSVASVLPPPSRQAEALEWLARGRADGSLDPQRIRATFSRTAAEEGLRVEPFEPGLDLLGRALDPGGPVTRASILELPQGHALLDRYLREVDGGWKSVIKIYNLPGRPKREVPRAALDLADSLGPGATLTGINVLSQGLRGEIRNDAVLSALIGLVLVAILLWIDFRGLRASMLALWPLLVGIVWMIGALVAFDLRLNFMNIFVITMILGIGVDYGIHVIHRFLEEKARPGGDVAAAVEETTRGVTVAALTTIVGFGSLATSHYPGLVSMGVVSILGTLATALVAIAVVPAWLAWRTRPR